MLTVLFASLSSFLGEISSSVIKFETDHHKESVYTAGFINTLFGILVFGALALIRGSFIFQLASLPTFLLKAVLEIFQAQATMLGLKNSDRSTYSFVRNLTIPLLLLVDMILGFSISSSQWFGIGIIFLSLFLVLKFHVLNIRGIGYSLFTAVNAVLTISLFKYNITRFNSVEAEQILTLLILLFYFLIAATAFGRENPLSLLTRWPFLGQGATNALGSILGAFAISFGNPGIATAAGRSSAVLASILSGRSVFNEKHFGWKLFVGCGLILGLILLAS